MNFALQFLVSCGILSTVDLISASSALPADIQSLLRPVDISDPDALLKFVVSELEKSKKEAGTLGACQGIEVANIVSKQRRVENGQKYTMELKVKPVHIVTDKCNNNAVKNVIPSTIEECEVEIWESLEPAGETHPMALLKSSCKIQKD